MTRNAAYLLPACLAFILAIPPAFADDVSGQPGAAVADTVEAHEAAKEEATKTAYELQQQIETAQEAYGVARDEADQIQESIDETTARIEQLESEIPAQQARSAKAARDQYKLQQQSVSVIDFLLSADSIDDFISGVEYMTKVSDANTREMNRLADLKVEVEETRNGLRQSYDEATARADEANEALASLQEAQAEVQRRIEEEARLAAEIAAQAEALAEHPRDNDEGSIDQADEGSAEGSADARSSQGSKQSASSKAESESEHEESESGSPDESGEADEADEADETDGRDESSNSDADSDANAEDEGASAESAAAAESDSGAPSDEASFIAEWAPRIDAYLAGSPLAGQGTTFAKAAYTYNVDPRWSPAISFTESSKGLYCFASHNAWGWGSSSWATWEEAIDAHVGGLSRGYGYTISEEAARKYCPPTWQSWYDRTLSQMNMI